MTVLMRFEGLVKHYPGSQGGGAIRAVDGVTLEVHQGECLAIVGESGSGKSTLGRCALALARPSAGTVYFEGQDLFRLRPQQMRHKRRELQMVFQDPVGSLSPRRTVGQILVEPLEIHETVAASAREDRAAELLDLVGLPSSAMSSYPHELSGGQRQRVAIARALATEPRFLVADEPVSALDVSLRGQILNLLEDLRVRFELTILLIAHDLALVEQLADRVVVMYAGRIVEQSSTESMYRQPQHPYTVCLLGATPGSPATISGTAPVPLGEPPDPSALPVGCKFHPRCPIAIDRCRVEEPGLVESHPGHEVACFLPGDLINESSYHGGG